MKKTHRQYLDRAVRLAIKTRESEAIINQLDAIKSGKSPVYSVIRDIVSDARFFSITDSVDNFWHLYGVSRIMRFIDSVPVEIWLDDERLTLSKEEFLNTWLVNNIQPISAADREAKLSQLINDNLPSENESDVNSDDDDEIFGVSDCTEGSHNAGVNDLVPELKDYMMNVGRGESQGHNAEAEFLDSIPPSLVDFAEMIGRSGAMSSQSRSRFRSSARSDIDGVSVGDDLNSLLPAELSLLASPTTQNLFYHRFTQKRLQIFSSASHISAKSDKQKFGPIYVCIDTSSSMTGQPERIAKMLALAICIVAQRRNRPVCLVNYSFSVSFFVLRNLARQRSQLLSFLSRSYGGGNTEECLFSFLFEKLPESKKYRNVLKAFDGADILIISDYNWEPHGSHTESLLLQNHSGGTRYFALGVADHGRMGFHNKELGYLKLCDGIYDYEKGKINKSDITNNENAT